MSLLLVGDIGGTTARFALAQGPDATGRFAVSDPQSLRGDDFSTLVDAADAYLQTLTGPRPEAACLAIAGPAEGARLKLTNRGWDFSREELARDLGLTRVEVFNDWAAMTRALPMLEPKDYLPLAAGAPAAHAPMVGFGPGTGLGLAVLAPLDADRWRVLATEAGHQGFAPGDDLEVEILRFARREHTFVSAEMILSGSGLVMLHRALSAIEGARYHILSAPEITQTGLSHDDPICVRTLEVFCAVMGGFAGDAAVAYGARGGVYVGGGVAQRLATILPHSPFEARFRERGPMSGYVAGVPARLIRSQDAAFAGAAGLFHDTLHEKGSLL